MNRREFHFRLAAGFSLALPACAQPGAAGRSFLEAEVTPSIQALMQEHRIPGMSVGILASGQHHLFHYGVASRETNQPVHDGTLFEVGSFSKPFTGLLGGWAAAQGRLGWSDPVSRHLPALRGSSFDAVSMLSLATYTAGGLPLQVPDGVSGHDAMLAYYRAWQPAFAPGTHRQYSNASIGLFGHVAARSLGAPFAELMERSIFPALRLRHTFYQVPKDRMTDYAWGYRDERPVRVAPGLWDAQAYGVKTTAADLLQFVALHIDPHSLAPELRQATEAALATRYRVGPMAQGLGWELYESGSTLGDLLAGNSADMALKPQAVSRSVASPRALVNKTGSTNGFGAYALFDRTQRTAVVLLANRNYPNAARVRAAHRLLTALRPRQGVPVA